MFLIASLVLTMWMFYEAWYGLSDRWAAMLWTGVLVVNSVQTWHYFWCGNLLFAISAALGVGIAAWELWLLWAYEPIDLDEE